MPFQVHTNKKRQNNYKETSEDKVEVVVPSNNTESDESQSAESD